MDKLYSVTVRRLVRAYRGLTPELQKAAKLQTVQERSEFGDEAIFSDLREHEIANIESALSAANYSLIRDAAETVHNSQLLDTRAEFFAAHTIIIRTSSPLFYHSLTSTFAVVQALLTLVVTKTGGDAVKIIEAAEEPLSRISAYW